MSFLATMLVLVGCDTDNQTSEITSEKVTTSIAKPSETKLPAKPKPAAKATNPPKNTLASQSTSNNAAATSTTRKPLVLKVDQTMLTSGDTNNKPQPIANTQVLPNLFKDDGTKEKKVISGGLLVNKESGQLDKAIDGAEISFELQTN
ncbi:hypothetical protein H0A36_03770 [Endozoicomonas sp. SM1973]|uniref:Uncharacterized protein n=2 Tax=Spartinivicinus marinus TaxID=2994442 RepID=A0A853I4P3_9GAMM|nr:hypothetical protein [Spartinivicinus marinus]